MNQEQKIVTFKLGEDEYGLDIGCVQEIRGLGRFTHVPQAPDFVEGVFKLRGKTVPLIDLRKRMNIPIGAHQRSERVIVVEIESRILGMIVDSVGVVLAITQGCIDKPDSVLDSANYLKGVARVSGRMILLVDIGKVLMADQVDGIKGISEKMAVVSR